MKRISIFVLLCVFVFTAGAAWATDSMPAPDDNGTIKLTEHVTLSSTYEIGGTVKKIDLNGHNITATNCRALWIKSGDVTITGSGTISANKGTDNNNSFSDGSSVIRVGDASTNSATAKLTIDKNVTISSNHCYGITVFGKNGNNTTYGQELIINGTVSVTGTASAISGNGSSSLSNTYIEIGSTAKISATNDVAIYHPQSGDLIVNGGTITGKSGIEFKSGNSTIKGGTITATTKTPVSPTGNSNGTSSEGFSVAVLKNSSYKGGNGIININGGQFEGHVAISDDAKKGNGAQYNPSIKITKGIFLKTTYQTSDDLIQSVDKGVSVAISGNYIYVGITPPSSGGDTGGGGGGTAPVVEEENKTAEEQNKETLESLDDGTQETADAIDAAEKAIENVGVTKPLSAEEAAALVQNQKEIAQEKTTEAVNNEVAESTVPAASDLLSDTPLATLDNLSAAPKATEPDRPTDSEQAEIVANLSASNLNNVDADSKKDIPADFDPSEIQQATEENLTIDALTKSLSDQAELIQDLFNVIKDFLTRVIVNNENQYGVVLSTRMPTLRPHTTGYFPMKMNMRNLVPGQRPRFWASTEAFKAAASSGNSAQKATASLAADDKEGSAFFLDSNGNPTTVISGDASKMTVVPYLVAGTTYDSAFITVDATESDQKALEALAAQEESTTEKDSTSSNSSSGGCEAGLGLAALAVLAIFAKKR